VQLLDFQVGPAEAVGEIAFTKGSALMTCPTGFGKMYMGAHVAREAQLLANIDPIVICPKIATHQWGRVLGGFGVTNATVTNYEMAIRHFVSWQTYGDLKWCFWKPEFHGRLVIFDESHRCGGLETQNGKMMASSRQHQMKSIQMSATPADSPLRMRAMVTTLGICGWDAYWSWARVRGCHTRMIRGRAKGLEFTKGAKGKKIMSEISAEFYPEYGSLVSINDASAYYNDHHVMVDCPLIPGADRVWIEAEREVMQLANERGSDPASLKLGARIRARKAVELLKVPTLLEMAKDGLESGYSVVVFMNFTESLLGLAEALKCAVIYGEDRDRQQSIDDFQSGVTNCLVVNTAAGSEAVSLHDTVGDAPRLALISPGENSTQLAQALGRTHRVGARSPATSKLIYAADSLEEQVAENVNRKLGNLGALTDNDLEFF